MRLGPTVTWRCVLILFAWLVYTVVCTVWCTIPRAGPPPVHRHARFGVGPFLSQLSMIYRIIGLLPRPTAGHSLGGALAVLATSAIRRQHPDSEITVYTLGCPRVGAGT